jgi:hypothetical protein
MASINVRAHIIASSKDISLSTANGVARSVNLKGIIVADANGASESGTMNPGLKNVPKLALEKACFLDYEDA